MLDSTDSNRRDTISGLRFRKLTWTGEMPISRQLYANRESA